MPETKAWHASAARTAATTRRDYTQGYPDTTLDSSLAEDAHWYRWGPLAP